MEIVSILDCTSASTSSDFELSNRWNNSCVSNISLLVWWYRASIADAEKNERICRVQPWKTAASVRVLNVTDGVISDNHVVLHHGLGGRSADGRANKKLFFVLVKHDFATIPNVLQRMCQNWCTKKQGSIQGGRDYVA